MTPSHPGGRRVVVVTGGGGGIGAAIALELGRRGDHVVTVDPLVTLDGRAPDTPAGPAPEPEPTTAERIVAAGGSARATPISVTDRDAVHALFAALVEEHGRLDAVVNVAGITRPTGFARGSDEDWRAVLEVHLDGYRNVLEAALPRMAAAGRGHVLGVTSGSGWRPADAGAYSCAKRAVAALTWELGRHAPPGVVVNAISPIAVTRMVTAALERARAAGGSRAGGLSLDSMPEPDDVAPLAAHLVGPAFGACRGQVLFAGGSEAAVLEPPHLLEVVRTTGAASVPALLAAATEGGFVPAERAQLSAGGTNPRFAEAYRAGVGAGDALADSPTGPTTDAPTARTCAVVADRPEVAEALVEVLSARGLRAAVVASGDPGGSGRVGFAEAAEALTRTAEELGSLDAAVVALAGSGPAAADDAEPWARVLAQHRDIVEQLYADGAWARAVADRPEPVRLVTLTAATTSGGRSRAQASAQLARAARGATRGAVRAFAVAVEAAGAGPTGLAADLAAHLVADPATDALAGAELAVGDGWVGLRSHPRARGSLVLGAADLPEWFDAVLAELTGGRST